MGRGKGGGFPDLLTRDWARCFDHLGLMWEYGESAGPEWSNPLGAHFWLPASEQVALVDPPWTPEFFRAVRDAARVAPLRAHVGVQDAIDVLVACLEPSGRFYGYARLVAHESTILTGFCRLELAQCAECRGWWLFNPDGGWACACCGYRAGRCHFRQLHRCPLRGWPLVQGEA